MLYVYVRSHVSSAGRSSKPPAREGTTHLFVRCSDAVGWQLVPLVVELTKNAREFIYFRLSTKSLAVQCV